MTIDTLRPNDKYQTSGLISYERMINGRLYAVQSGEITDEIADSYRSSMIECRNSFVQMMQWKPSTVEGCDRADLNTGTIHMARFDDSHAATTMRLTPFDINRIGVDSLSLGEMLDRRPDMRQSAIENLEQLLIQKEVDRTSVDLYDLTRLTVDMNGAMHADNESILRDTATMIGIGIRETDALRDTEEGVVAWTFCLHPAMKGLLDGMGIQSHVLTSGEITEGDGYDSVVCIAFPKSAYEFVVDDFANHGDDAEYAFTHRHVTDGINS